MRRTEVQNAHHCTTELDALMNLIVCITHEDQFQASVQGMAQIKRQQGDVIQQSLGKWSSIFTGHTWIINRKTPPHRDRGGFKAGFDYLSVLGTASSFITLRDINITAQYNPGTVVGVPGRVLVHEVSTWGKGDRICVAQWIRQRLLSKHGIQPINWPKVSGFNTRFGW
jgi:hypothetical protein